MNNCQPNHVRVGETMTQFHARVLAQYPDAKIAPVVAWMRGQFAEPVIAQIRAAIAADPDSWVAPYHFYWGMSIRNQMRTAGFGEDYWPIWNLDDIYVPLVERAVAGS